MAVSNLVQHPLWSTFLRVSSEIDRLTLASVHREAVFGFVGLSIGALSSPLYERILSRCQNILHRSHLSEVRYYRSDVVSGPFSDACADVLVGEAVECACKTP